MEEHPVIGKVLLAVPFVLLGVFLIYPVFYVITEGLLSGPGSTLVEVLSSPAVQRVIGFTIFQAVLSTALSLLLGLPGAVILAKLDFRGKSVLRAALIVPFVLPPIVVVVGFIQVFGAGGPFDALAMFFLGASESVFDLSSGLPGIILVHAFYNIPLYLLMVSSALQRLNPEIEEAA
jgi:thiamine transport system permease protein